MYTRSYSARDIIGIISETNQRNLKNILGGIDMNMNIRMVLDWSIGTGSELSTDSLVLNQACPSPRSPSCPSCSSVVGLRSPRPSNAVSVPWIPQDPPLEDDPRPPWDPRLWWYGRWRCCWPRCRETSDRGFAKRYETFEYSDHLQSTWATSSPDHSTSIHSTIHHFTVEHTCNVLYSKNTT